jgi:pimeloyl-ACP methyl ester carboxylesterase
LIGTGAERTVRVGGAQRSYLEVGAGSPLVLLHGIGSRAFSWSTQLERWSAGYRVIAWDAPGYGGSDDLPSGWSAVTDYADELRGFLDALSIERPVVIGHSLGALIAGAFAARSPDRVRGLVLLSVACGYGRLSSADRERRYEVRARELTALGVEAFSEKRAAALVSPGASQEMIARIGEAMRTIRPSGYLGALRMLMDADFLGFAPRIAAPTLVACGSRDTVTPPEQNRRVADGISGSTFVLVEGAGHAVGVERPDELDACVLPFLASLPETPQ